MKMMLIGDLTLTSRVHALADAMRDEGHQVLGIPIETNLDADGKPKRLTLLYRVLWKLGFDLDRSGLNDRILSEALKEKPDQIWAWKPTAITPATLRTLKAKLPNTTLISFCEDDMHAWHNQTWFYRWGLKYFDTSITTKSYNMQELPKLGAKHMIFIDNSFDRHRRKPMPLTPDEQKELSASVGFIGSYEPDRAAAMLFLAENGIQVRIWGNLWNHFPHQHPNLLIESKPMTYEPDGLGYAKGICAIDINLCFLRKINRDLQTGRSIEIPACGAFMLAERTEEHQRLFAEGEECAFFGSNQELLDKVRYYLDHPDERRRVAENGLRRCLQSDYSYHGRLKVMLAKIAALTSR